MIKWVCVTKDWDTFTYGKIYEGEVNGSLLDVANDLGERTYPAISGSIPIGNYKESRRYFGAPTKKVYYFITLDEWRQQQIEKIL